MKASYDEPNGIIIGAYSIAWQVSYDGRPQTQKFYAESEEWAIIDAQATIADLKLHNSGHPCYLYSDDSLWSLHLWS